ncbi:polysaccharide biosynthesis/export family protein [Crateriforma spongiae]|uniref:polysaccharide biosynthesis/export family protein n=1 Tax=Crateriforma spongiae TaxID=2724528 RepID=UPI0039AF379F
MTKTLSAGRRIHRCIRTLRTAATALAAGVAVTAITGCSTLTQPINGVPANRLPPEFFPEPKNDLVPVDISLLSLEPPREYLLDGGDILGVYIEGVLPFNPPNEPPEPPPVNFPEADNTLPPSIGYPIAIQDDGTLALPLIEPLDVAGLTLEQVRDKIRDAYIDEEILIEEKARPIVTLIQKRTYNIIVIREDGLGDGRTSRGLQRQDVASQFIRGGSDRSGSGSMVKLNAYENDILHALVETGGLPGLNAKNQVKVLRANRANQEKYREFVKQFYAQQECLQRDPCYCPPELPEDPSILRVPLRVRPGEFPDISDEDITLNDGDIVYIESRETEVFYTGGLLPGGEFPLPRDYDLDVLGALALAGAGVGGTAQNSGGGISLGRSPVAGVPPGRVYILRKLPCNQQVAIEVDISEATNNPAARVLIQPGDVVLLQYKCEEEIINAGIGTFFTFGIAEILRN